MWRCNRTWWEFEFEYALNQGLYGWGGSHAREWCAGVVGVRQAGGSAFVRRSVGVNRPGVSGDLVVWPAQLAAEGCW